MRAELLAVPLAVAALSAAGLWRIARDAAARPPEKADAIVVFGAAIWPTGPSVAMRLRAEHAADLHAAGWAPVVLCSGGLSDGRSEGQAMRGLLIERGVPAAAIIPDDGGVTTRGAICSARRFGAGRWRRIIAVSSGYHMHRISREGRRQGIDVITCPALRPGPLSPRLAIHDTRQYLRELLAVPAYAMGAWVHRASRAGPGRLFRRAWREVSGRLRFVAGEADAVAEAQERIAGGIKARIPRFADTQQVLTPASGLRLPVAGTPGDRFGLRHRRLHAGLDVRAPYGAPVVAAAAGAVLIAAAFGPYGNAVVVDHGGGLTTVYAHLAGYVVAEGELLAQGQRLGFVGETGRSSGPHLHFEVRVHGSPVDPDAYLPA